MNNREKKSIIVGVNVAENLVTKEKVFSLAVIVRREKKKWCATTTQEKTKKNRQKKHPS